MKGKDGHLRRNYLFNILPTRSPTFMLSFCTSAVFSTRWNPYFCQSPAHSPCW